MAKDRDIEDIMEEKVNKFRDRVNENIDRLKDHVDDAREKFDDVRERGEEGWKEVTRFAQKNPTKALGAAFLIGAALGIILFGGRNRD